MNREDKNKDLWFALIVIPAIFVIGALGLLGLERVAENNSRVCTFSGKVWLAGSPGDPEARSGCFSYEELYQ